MSSLRSSTSQHEASLLSCLREGVYKAVARATKQGTPVVRKSELVAQIQAALGTNQLESLVKASKADLQALAELAERAEFS